NSQDHKSNEHLVKSEAKKDENESSAPPCDRTEQTVSGNTDQISHTTTAYDKGRVCPDQEIEDMKKKNHQVFHFFTEIESVQIFNAFYA
ncbi:14820_t:CDS:1, partial [Racocetra fulgida]